jgi:hypothetical protein
LKPQTGVKPRLQRPANTTRSKTRKSSRETTFESRGRFVGSSPTPRRLKTECDQRNGLGGIPNGCRDFPLDFKLNGSSCSFSIVTSAGKSHPWYHRGEARKV